MSEELRQYLAVLIVATVAAGSTLALGALAGLLRPPRRAPATGARPDARPGHGGARVAWRVATATVLVGLGSLLIPAVLAPDELGGRAAVVTVAVCVVGAAVGLLLHRRTEPPR